MNGRKNLLEWADGLSGVPWSTREPGWTRRETEYVGTPVWPEDGVRVNGRDVRRIDRFEGPGGRVDLLVVWAEGAPTMYKDVRPNGIVLGSPGVRPRVELTVTSGSPPRRGS